MKKCIILFGFITLGINLHAQDQPAKIKTNAHDGGVNALAISSDGNILVSGGNDFKTFVWNTKTTEKLKGAMKQNDKVNAVAINASNKLYVSGCSDMKVRVVDIAQGVPIRILAEHTAAVTAVAFNPINDYIVSGAKDNSLKVWDNSKSKTSVFTLSGHSKEITSVVFSPDGKRLVSAALDNTIKIWDALAGTLIQTIDIDSKGVSALSFSGDGKYLAGGGGNGKVTLWDGKTFTKVKEFEGVKGQINTVTFSPDVQYVIAGGDDKKILIWHTETEKTVKEIGITGSNVSAIAFNSAMSQLISGGIDGGLIFWDMTELKFGLPKYPKPEVAPTLVCTNLTIADENSNGIIEGGEKASLTFTVKNQSKGDAYRLIAKLSLDNPTSDISFDKEVFIGNLGGDKSQSISIPINANADLQAGNGAFVLNISEANGSDASPTRLSFQTGGAGSYSYIMVMNQSYTSATGKAEIGAPITLKLKIKNITKGAARNIKVNFLLPEHVFAVNKISEQIPAMAAGEEREIAMEFYADKTFTLSEIKMGVDIEGAAFTNAKELILRVKLNENLSAGEDYSADVIAQANELEQQKTDPNANLYRGGGDPLKGLNVSKAKTMVIGNYYALIIGIDKYKGTWPVLQNATNDARAIEKLLRASYKFEFFKTLYNEQANRENIIAQLEWLVANVKAEDNVFIYYSGHGEYKKELNKGYWVPADAENSSTAKYISNSDIQTYISGIKGKHTLLVSDACFSGDIFRGNTVSVPFEESEKYYKEVQSLSSRQALTSGGLEPVMDGGKDGHSVFAYYFLKTLESNQSKYFDASQLYTKVKIPVINNSEQTPKFSPIKNTGDEGGQFIFIKKP